MSRSDGQVPQKNLSATRIVEVAATVEITALSGKNKAKGQFISCSRQLIAGVHGAGLDVLGAKNDPRKRDFTRLLSSTAGRPGRCSNGRRMLTWNGDSAAATADKQSSKCSANVMYRVLHRGKNRAAKRDTGVVDDRA